MLVTIGYKFESCWADTVDCSLYTFYHLSLPGSHNISSKICLATPKIKFKDVCLCFENDKSTGPSFFLHSESLC